MKLKEIVKLLDARVLTNGADLEMEVRQEGQQILCLMFWPFQSQI